MITDIVCKTQNSNEEMKEIRTNVATAQFLRQVLNQERRVKELLEHEKQLTAENPRIRDQNEITDISTELKQIKHDELVQQKRRQQLRTNNHELRTLELQLRTAITSKELAKQRQYLEDKMEQMEISKRKENEKIEKERLDYLQSQLEQEKKERNKKSEMRAQLLNQIKDMQIKRKEDYTEVMRDREDMQKLMRKYDMERENELREIERCKKETRETMETFLNENAELRKIEQSSQRSDGAIMLKMLEEQEKERERIKNTRIKTQEQYAALSDRIGKDLYETTAEQRKRENLLLDLLVEERNAKEEMRYRNELEKKGEQRTQMRGELDRYLSEVKYLKKYTKEREDEFWANEAKKMLDKKDKEEQHKAEEKHKRTREYKKSILELVEDRRHMRAMNAAEERNRYELIIKEQHAQDEEVQRERLRMLQECSSDLFRYLPVGALRDTDKMHLGLSHPKLEN